MYITKYAQTQQTREIAFIPSPKSGVWQKWNTKPNHTSVRKRNAISRRRRAIELLSFSPLLFSHCIAIACPLCFNHISLSRRGDDDNAAEMGGCCVGIF